MLLESKLSTSFWPDAVRAATYVLNRSPVSGKSKLPAELFHDGKVNVNKLRVFECVGYSHIPRQFRGKFDSKSRVGIFIGYANGGYRVYDPVLKKDFISRNVIFDESKNVNDIMSCNVNKKEPNVNAETLNVDVPMHVEDGHDENVQDVLGVDEGQGASQDRDPVDSSSPGGSDTNVNLNDRPLRTRRIPQRLLDYALFCPMSAPTSYTEAVSEPDADYWIRAMKTEMSSMYENKVWTLVDENIPDVECVDCRWVYSYKRLRMMLQFIKRDLSPEGLCKIVVSTMMFIHPLLSIRHYAHLYVLLINIIYMSVILWEHGILHPKAILRPFKGFSHF